MLLSETIQTKWNPKNKTRYVSLGYRFTAMGDSVSIKISDIAHGSAAMVELSCDYCGHVMSRPLQRYNATKEKQIVSKDCCKGCISQKAQESIMAKYGDHVARIPEIKKKRARTNLARYGVTNVFQSKAIKEKIVKSNLAIYGVECCQQNELVREKTRQTCMERYGVEDYVQLLAGQFIREKSPVWKGGVDYSRVERATYEYNQWRRLVFGRDSFCCARCGAKSSKGTPVELNARHILNWRDNPEKRYDIDNGTTLCSICHTKFHSIYGKRNNTPEQLHAFLEIDKEIC